MVTSRQVKRAVAKGLFDEERLVTSDFVAAQEDGVTLQAGEIGNVFEAEVGETVGRLGEAAAVIVGQNPDPSHRTFKGKPSTDLDDDGDADVPQGTKYRIVERKQNSKQGQAITGWRDAYRDDPNQSGVSIENIEVLTPKSPVVREDTYLVYQVKNEGQSFNASLSDSALELPVQVWDGGGI
jgi:hypothetical protein